LASSIIVVAALILLMVVASGQSKRSEKALLASAEWIEGLPIERYGPMLWLLSDTRLCFLRSHGGLAIEMRIRVRRGRLFRRYLGSLKADFRLTCTALKTIMVLSPHDRPDLASTLLRAQITFFCRVLVVKFRLLRYRCGLS
jgi:hypothetical protein